MLLEEAKDSYGEDIVVAMKNDSVDDINKYLADLSQWVSAWCNQSAWNDDSMHD